MLLPIVVALLQVGAEPAPQAAPETAPPAAIAETQPAAPPQGASAEEQAQPERRRRCTVRQITGTRLQSLVTCRSRESQQDIDTREALRDLQRPAPTNAN